jgi:chemotaxis protein histidine kinase CheA
MSFTNELSNFNASLEVTELLMKTLENAARNLAARCISEVASRHGFDAEKEIQALGLENLSLIRKQMAKKSAAKGEKKEKKPREPKKSAFPMPFFAENVNTDGCQGLAYNRGLFTQCTKNKCETGFYCKGCQIEADKNSSGQPDCGNVSSRLATGLYEFKDPKGRSPISYIKVITKLNITLEQVSEETGKTGKTIPSQHLVVEKKLSGRGRPKKVSVVETDDVSTVISDIFAKINLNAIEEEVIEEEVIEEEEEVLEVDNKPKKLALSETEKAEKKRLLEAEKAEKAEKKAALEAEKAEKAEQKRLLEVEKAEQKRLLEVEKAEKKAALEAEKAEKKAALEAEKAEKKAALEAEKAEKKAKEKEERKSKREAEKGTQKSKKENKDDSDNDSEKAEPVKEPVKETVKEAETPPASAPPNNKVKVSRIQISGKSYLKTVDNVLYDPDTRDEVGIWDPETKTMKPLPQEEEQEEQEEEYDSN